MCKGNKAILTLDRCRQTELRSETEQVMSTTGGTMITLVHQLERENWSTRAIHGYYLYIIAWESTTVSNSGLCTRVHNTIGCCCTLQNVLEAKSRPSIVIQDNSPFGNKRNVPKENNRERTISVLMKKDNKDIPNSKYNRNIDKI